MTTATLSRSSNSSSTVDLTQRAMLVDLTIKSWSASKTDKAVGREVAEKHQSDETMGRYSKKLIGKEALETLRKLAQDAAAEHRRRTLPWMDSGSRILSSAGYLEYASVMRKYESQWDDAVADFVRSYPDFVEDAKRRLNGLFKSEEYPSPSEIRDKFTFGYNVMPVPDASDFRVELGTGERARIQRQIEESTQVALETAMRDVSGRIREVVSHMAERLKGYQPSANGKAEGVFRDSLVANVRDLAAILPSLNLTGNAELATLAQRIQDELTAYSPDALRANQRAREETAAAAESILKQMGNFI